MKNKINNKPDTGIITILIFLALISLAILFINSNVSAIGTGSSVKL